MPELPLGDEALIDPELDAMQDLQETTTRSLRVGSQMAQLWGLGWPTGPGDVSESKASPEQVREEIQAQFKRAQAAAYNSALPPQQRAEEVSAYYSEDVRWLLEGLPTIEGRENMKAMWAVVFSWQDLEFEYEATELEVAPAGDMAWEIGWMKMSGKPPDPYPRTEFDGRYCVTARTRARNS